MSAPRDPSDVLLAIHGLGDKAYFADIVRAMEGVMTNPRVHEYLGYLLKAGLIKFYETKADHPHPLGGIKKQKTKIYYLTGLGKEKIIESIEPPKQLKSPFDWRR